MFRVMTLTLTFFAAPALAHPGHIAEAAGHNHWLAGVLIGGAIATAILGALKGKKQEPEATETDHEAEPQEA
ncbi:DUF6732 family protein [Celeribacter baekdonensis]|uniref:DUF6732 family protein n=1 Tax=Celeribacter baekdonensis TaxID=875171 RepID=UPI0030D9B477